MTTSAEMRSRIAQLQAQLREDIAQLEQRCRAEVGALERDIRANAAVEVSQARAAIKAILQAHGLSADDVLGSLAVPRGPNKHPAKARTMHYVGPDGQTWSGIGRHPAWIKDKNFADYAQPLAA